jgi:hypothetical protein
VTDIGLKELNGFVNLTYLDLSGTQVTDAGLEELKGLKTLTELNLTGTQVTDAGVSELQKALPQCKIKRTRDARHGSMSLCLWLVLPAVVICLIACVILLFRRNMWDRV